MQMMNEESGSTGVGLMNEESGSTGVGLMNEDAEDTVAVEVGFLLNDVLHQVASEGVNCGSLSYGMVAVISEAFQGSGNGEEVLIHSQLVGNQPVEMPKNTNEDGGEVPQVQSTTLVRFDGACPGNPGPGGVGVVAYLPEVDGTEPHVLRVAQHLGARIVADVTTNNFTEYIAALNAVKLVKEVAPPRSRVFIQGDSALVINQMNGFWNCVSEELKKIKQQIEVILEELEESGVNVYWGFLPRDLNSVADRLVNIVLEGGSVASQQGRAEAFLMSAPPVHVEDVEGQFIGQPETLPDTLEYGAFGSLLLLELKALLAKCLVKETPRSDHQAAWNAILETCGNSSKRNKNRSGSKSSRRTENSRHTKTLRLLREGEDGRAMDALSETALAPRDDQTLIKLQKLHPAALVRPVDNVTLEGVLSQPDVQTLQLTPKEVTRALFSSRSTSAPGPSGMSFGELKAVGGSREGRDVLTKILNLMLKGWIPNNHPLRDSTMVALDKGEGHVRPIAVGESIYRLCGRAVIKAHGAALADVLQPHQFGFAVKGGAECIVHLVHSKLREKQHTVATLDVSNAFNSVDRSHMRKMVQEYTPELLDFFSWDYGGPVVAWWDNQEIISECGVKQGGPLSPFYFALALKEPLEEAAELFPEVEIVAYLDDITVVGKNSQVKDVFVFLKDKLASIGLRVNPGKTQLLFPVESAAEDSLWWNGVVQEDVLCAARRPEHTIKVLGIPFGPPLSQMKVVLDTIVHGNAKLKALETAAEEGLPPQAVMRLVANCLSRQPNFWLRCLPPVVMKEPVSIFKGRLYDFLKRALQLPSDTVLSEEVLNRLDLPVKMGGLGWGLLNPEIAFVASFVASMRGLSHCGRVVWDNPFENADGVDIPPVVPEWLQPVHQNLAMVLGDTDAVFSAFKDTPKLQHRLTNKLHVILREKLVSDENYTMAKKTLWKVTTAPGALAWVYAAPRKGFTFNPTEYAKALKLLLGLPQLRVHQGWNKVCCVHPANNPNGSHVAPSCLELWVGGPGSVA
jgi:ribonuclease HI